MAFDPNDIPEGNLEEIVAQGEIASAAWDFLRFFYSGDLISAWGVIHPVLRLCWAQWWVDANRSALKKSGHGIEESAESLAQDSNGKHALWEDFERVILRDFRAAFPLDVDSAAIGSLPRAIALDTELLYVHPNSPDGGLWQPGEEREVYPLVMRLTDDKWKVLNWASDAVPTPGYLPVLFSETEDQ